MAALKSARAEWREGVGDDAMMEKESAGKAIIKQKFISTKEKMSETRLCLTDEK